jgi:UDP-N-acetylmuramate dehydrogenase
MRQNMMPELLADYPLRTHNTFGFDVQARYAQSVDSAATLGAALSDPRTAGLPRLVLGGGSNIVLTRDFDGVVWLMALRGRRLVQEDAEARLIEAGAGENWHDFVQWTLAQGWPGLENLALIPGSVGAAPIQNIGAYGLEVAARIQSVQAVEIASGESITFDVSECRFAYRDSLFKQQKCTRFVIVSVTFRLSKTWQPVLDYPALAEACATRHIINPAPRDIFNAVVALRREKLPDPSHLGNAGSFFKNPLISAAQFDVLQTAEPDIIAYYQADESVKLAAGWLIEQCGWKGRILGRAAVHAKQALILVNGGGACGTDILALAGAIQHDVHARFGVWLEPEPVIL